jgi:drug/metabolite transporter (DMT)-like permease
MATTMYPSFADDEFNEDHQRSHSRSHSRQLSHDSRLQRQSRNSIGVKEELILGPREEDEQEDLVALLEGEPAEADNTMLITVFCAMVGIGLGNKVFNKLMTIPMYNYPNFLNLLTSFVYIPVCFAYIIPMAKNGYIPAEQFEVPKKSFAIMGGLDALAGIMQIFGATYLPGPLIILLLQAAIPVSMVISKYLLKATYNTYQYIGALIVAGGIMVVLAPSLTGGGNIIWALVLILSTVPMTLSSVYKEIALGETELDAVSDSSLTQTLSSCFSPLPFCTCFCCFVSLPGVLEWVGGRLSIFVFVGHCHPLRSGV